MGGIPAAPLLFTEHAAGEITGTTFEWPGEMTLTGEEKVTIGSTVTINDNTTLKVAEGKTLTINGGINCNGHTLTVDEPGTVTVIGNEGDDCGGYGIWGNGNVILKKGTLNVTGGIANGEDSGEGGYGIWGDVEIAGGTLNANGGMAVTMEAMALSEGSPKTAERWSLTEDQVPRHLAEMALADPSP